MGFDRKKEYLTVAEIAGLLRTTRQTIYEYIKAGRLKGIKLGRRRLFPLEEIEAFTGSDISKKIKKKAVAITPELEKARGELTRADDLRKKGVSKELLDLVKGIKTVILKDGNNDDLAQLYFIEAGGYLNTGRFAKAAALLRTALDNSNIAGNSLLTGKIYGTLAQVEKARRNFDMAITYYDEALKIFRRINAKSSIAITYHNLGILYDTAKRSYDSIEHFLRAIEIANSTKMPRQFEPNILISLSDTYLTVGDNSQALNLAEKALKIGSRRKDQALIVRASSLMAKSLFNLRDKGSAGEFFRKTLDSWQQLPQDHQDRLISSAINSCIGLEDFGNCLKYLRRKDKILAAKPDPEGDIPWHFLNYTKCYLGLGDPEKAFEYATKGLEQQIELGQLDQLRSFNEMKAKCLFEMGNNAEACAVFDEALFHLEAEIARASSKETRGNLKYYLDEITDHYIDSLFKIPDKEAALHHAFNIVARDLRLIIATNGIYPDPIAGRFTARKYMRNAHGIADFFNSISSVAPGKLSGSQVKYHTDRLAKLGKSTKILVDKLIRENPFYLPLQGEASPSINEIKKLFNKGSIPSGSSLLFIILGPSGGQGFLLGKGGLKLRMDLRISRRQAKDYINAFLTGCRTIGTLAMAGSTPSVAEKHNLNGILNNLYSELLKPFAGHFDPDRPLVVLTDHSLVNLPWNALYDGDRYLCEYLRVYRVLSPAFLRVMHKQKAQVKKPKLLIVSPWATGKTDSILAHVKAIPNRRIKLSITGKAIIENVRPKIGKYDAFLYLGEQAAHSVNPQRANLRLYKGPGIIASDFFTQRYDLSGVKSILLYTGGVTQQGENKNDFFMPVQRAFLTAGANHVGTFLWRLDDSSLGRVLNELYNGFADNGTVGYEAIRQAQIRMIRDTMTSHPYFWAGIQNYNLTIEC